jgi:hypothetical protein
MVWMVCRASARRDWQQQQEEEEEKIYIHKQHFISSTFRTEKSFFFTE